MIHIKPTSHLTTTTCLKLIPFSLFLLLLFRLLCNRALQIPIPCLERSLRRAVAAKEEERGPHWPGAQGLPDHQVSHVGAHEEVLLGHDGHVEEGRAQQAVEATLAGGGEPTVLAKKV